MQQSHERFSDGTWIENSFFKALEVAEAKSDERFTEAGVKIVRWRTRYPGSAAAAIVQAGYHINLGWHARAEQTPKGRVECKREMELARLLLEANSGAKRVPEWFVKMQIMACNEDWEPSAFSQLFEEAIASQRDYYTFYFEAAHYAGMKGGRGAWERFAEEQRQRRGAADAGGDALYARTA